MKTTSPSRRGIIERVATVRVMLHTASTERRWTARQPLSEISSAGAVNWPPALLTSTSTWPKRSIAASTTRSGSPGSRTSAATARQAAPLASISARALSSGSSRRPARTTHAPLRASSSAVARPIPVPPPVTSATRPALASGRRGLRKVGERAGIRVTPLSTNLQADEFVCQPAVFVGSGRGDVAGRRPARATHTLTRDRPESYGCRQSTGGDQWRRWRIPGVSRASSGRR